LACLWFGVLTALACRLPGAHSLLGLLFLLLPLLFLMLLLCGGLLYGLLQPGHVQTDDVVAMRVLLHVEALQVIPLQQFDELYVLVVAVLDPPVAAQLLGRHLPGFAAVDAVEASLWVNGPQQVCRDLLPDTLGTTTTPQQAKITAAHDVCGAQPACDACEHSTHCLNLSMCT
jgi:hypothetical protein